MIATAGTTVTAPTVATSPKLIPEVSSVGATGGCQSEGCHSIVPESNSLSPPTSIGTSHRPTSCTVHGSSGSD